jgi:hypothetical protein
MRDDTPELMMVDPRVEMRAVEMMAVVTTADTYEMMTDATRDFDWGREEYAIPTLLTKALQWNAHRYYHNTRLSFRHSTENLICQSPTLDFPRILVRRRHFV